MTNQTIGILAHVDAGKTTLSESILYTTGQIRTRGRVDHQDAFLDTDALEKKRGITIYSKTARFTFRDRPYTILDTPGHVDFSPEMERALSVIDTAVLVISAADMTGERIDNPQVSILWKLLRIHKVPTLVFLNKMDQDRDYQENPEREKKRLLTLLNTALGPGFVPFEETGITPENEDAIAACSDDLSEKYLAGDKVTKEDVRTLVRERNLFPTYFGAALVDEGTKDLLSGLSDFTEAPAYPEKFGALVYKISIDESSANRQKLAFLKVTGGTLSVRDEVTEEVHESAQKDDEEESETTRTITEKISQIRLYNGAKYQLVTGVLAGEICAVTGLSKVRSGDGLGIQESAARQMLSPIETRTVTALDGTDRFHLHQALSALEEEEPLLHVADDPESGEIRVQIMGQVETQVLTQVLQERFGIRVLLGPGKIVYRESIAEPVEGVGHFEPLRHYAEVHLLLTPTGPGTGLTFENRTPAGMLDNSIQSQVMALLQAKTHRGVLTGAELTDMKITLLGGKQSRVHTVGGDFRKATFRAVRQGLMEAKNVLLEPVLFFTITLPKENLGRAMTDLTRMGARIDPASFEGEDALLTGKVPASEIGDYALTLQAYTGGRGRLSLSFADFEPCHNAEQVIEEAGYDPDADLRNPSSSVFCSHGAGTLIPWYEVKRHMHVESLYEKDPDFVPVYPKDTRTFSFALPEGYEEEVEQEEEKEESVFRIRKPAKDENLNFTERKARITAQEKELQEIFARTYGPVKSMLHNPENEERERVYTKEKNPSDPKYEKKTAEAPLEYLLIDGYNIIFDWEETRELARTDIKAARDRLLDIVSNYAGITGQITIVVFDAYKVPRNAGEVYRYHNIDVVYTKEAETADLYIEKCAHSLAKKHRVIVATSDAVEQVIIYGAGAVRLSARGFLEHVIAAEESLRQTYLKDD